ncbi:MAG: hypothetical protein HYR94_04705 [Chloroflexi bacterium]|nr:hypothetical protein [Chloroflexota bacterium]
MNARLFALVEQMNRAPQIEHWQGLPPELTGGQDYREKLPRPRVFVIEEKSEGVFLFRFAADGSFGGDTWHMSIDDAKNQAAYEYGDMLGRWEQIPPEVTNVVAFALAQA